MREFLEQIELTGLIFSPMFSHVNSCAVIGLDCLPIEVEIDLTPGYPCFTIIGLPDPAINEAKDRIRSTFKHADVTFPYNKRLVINLAPADLKKMGPFYDLPMMVGILCNIFEMEDDITNSLFYGELSLDGRLRPVNGILSVALYAQERGFKKLYIPAGNADEAALITELEIIPVRDIAQLIPHLLGQALITPWTSQETSQPLGDYAYDMRYIKGQEHVKRALEIAAAGGHNLLMSGPPGSGKTLLARTFPSILPQMTRQEILEVTKIYSVAGLLPHDQPLIQRRPFRAPHHSASAVALVGGGKFPKPGEISLSHRGVLFLDEFSEFPRMVLEHLRQPMEDGCITISRAQGTLTFPARFTLIASHNPCPCGYATDPDKPCTCTHNQMLTYQRRISGPLLDRIDMRVDVPRVQFEKLSREDEGEISEIIRQRVQNARDAQNKRFFDSITTTNAEMSPQEIQTYCKLNDECMELLKMATEKFHLSPRVYFRIIKLSRTIADLAESVQIQSIHVAESLQYRIQEKEI